jgi:hypothetical protein
LEDFCGGRWRLDLFWICQGGNVGGIRGWAYALECKARREGR